MNEKSGKCKDIRCTIGRRKFGKTALVHALGGGVLLSQTGCSKGEKPEVTKEKKTESKKGTSDILLSRIAVSQSKDDYLLFLKQLGLNQIELYISGDEEQYDNLVRLKKRFNDAGFEIAGLNNYKYWRYNNGESDIIKFGLEGRDKVIEDFKMMLRNMGRLGIPTYDMIRWEAEKLGFGVNSLTPRHLRTKEVDLHEIQKLPPAYDREYTEEEMWDSFAYFFKRVMPVAEENNVKIAIHPSLPLEKLRGQPLIFRNFENIKRGIEIADSKNFGLIFCMGTFPAFCGENALFGDTLEAMRYFGESNRIFHVHFRNSMSIDSPFHYYECFLDDGDTDMYQAMKILWETGYRGTLIPEHLPGFVDSSAGSGVGLAFAIGYIRALLHTFESEAGYALS